MSQEIGTQYSSTLHFFIWHQSEGFQWGIRLFLYDTGGFSKASCLMNVCCEHETPWIFSAVLTFHWRGLVIRYDEEFIPGKDAVIWNMVRMSGERLNIPLPWKKYKTLFGFLKSWNWYWYTGRYFLQVVTNVLSVYIFPLINF